MQPRKLEDEIFRLYRLNLHPRIARVVEEAERALTQGREMEAEALVEKAEALVRSRPALAR